jgi:hypothetical protein
MKKIAMVFTKKYEKAIPLTEGESYCSCCMHHADYCQCLQRATLSVPDELCDEYSSGKAEIKFEWKVKNG